MQIIISKTGIKYLRIKFQQQFKQTINTIRKFAPKQQREERRARCKEYYEFLAESATEIFERADLDKTRKGQMIHDLATQLDFNPEQFEDFEQTSLERLVE